jgi:hypothetical protein
MKTLKVTFFSLIASILLFSCQKEDMQQVPPTKETTETTIVNENIQWSTYAEWSEMKQENFSVNYTVIEDASITTSTTEKGMILVYKKDDASETSIQLPYEDKKGNTTNYWYYQVNENQILISCDVYGSSSESIQNSPLTYVTISEDVLHKLETKGYTKAELMNISYTSIKNIISNL